MTNCYTRRRGSSLARHTRAPRGSLSASKRSSRRRRSPPPTARRRRRRRSLRAVASDPLSRSRARFRSRSRPTVRRRPFRHAAIARGFPRLFTMTRDGTPAPPLPLPPLRRHASAVTTVIAIIAVTAVTTAAPPHVDVLVTLSGPNNHGLGALPAAATRAAAPARQAACAELRDLGLRLCRANMAVHVQVSCIHDCYMAVQVQVQSRQPSM